MGLLSTAVYEGNDKNGPLWSISNVTLKLHIN